MLEDRKKERARTIHSYYKTNVTEKWQMSLKTDLDLGIANTYLKCIQAAHYAEYYSRIMFYFND